MKPLKTTLRDLTADERARVTDYLLKQPLSNIPTGLGLGGHGMGADSRQLVLTERDIIELLWQRCQDLRNRPPSFPLVDIVGESQAAKAERRQVLDRKGGKGGEKRRGEQMGETTQEGGLSG